MTDRLGNHRTPPKVTVFIPVFNCEMFIAQAIDSIIAQTLADFELLIIDDGSTDETPAILKRYEADSRVRIVIQQENQGRPRTRNAGLELARGEYMALMDADDYCAPERLARQAAYLDSHPEVDVLGCLWSLSDMSGRALSSERPPQQLYTSDEIAAQMLFCCPVHQPTIMARTRVIASYRYDHDFPVAQDHELWSRMAPAHRFAVLPEQLMSYRQHSEQATAALAKMRSARQRVQARQLAELGLTFSDEDVLNHDRLFQLKGRRLFLELTGRELDLDFVRWARRWIEALAAANARHQRYPEPAFSRILGERWLLLCRKASGGAGGMAVWREFARSSLKRTAASASIHKVRTALLQR